jgi:hypothetical protein
MITVQKHAKIFYTVSITYHDNVVRIRDNSSVSASLVTPGPGGRLPSSQIEPSNETGGGHFEH